MKANCRLIHVLAEEGCAAILRLLFKCIDFVDVTDTEFSINFESEYVSANTLIILYSLVRESGIDICDNFGAIPLLYAAQGGHLEVVKFLFERGSNLNHMDSPVRPLGLAIEAFQFNVVKFMVEHGADLKANDSEGSILYGAITMNNANMIEYLLDNTLKCNKWNDIGAIIPYTFAYLGRLSQLKIWWKRVWM